MRTRPVLAAAGLTVALALAVPTPSVAAGLSGPPATPRVARGRRAPQHARRPAPPAVGAPPTCIGARPDRGADRPAAGPTGRPSTAAGTSGVAARAVGAGRGAVR